MYFWHSFIGYQNIHLQNCFINRMNHNKFKFDRLKSPEPKPTILAVRQAKLLHIVQRRPFLGLEGLFLAIRYLYFSKKS